MVDRREDEGGTGPVLIVDDNVALAENIAEILEGQGFATEVAASAEEALAKALIRRISVVITDFRLPGITGAELIGRLRRHGVDLRAMVISAYNDEATIADAHEAGAEFMAKPVDFVALHRFVDPLQRSA
jgi:DNA-binding response OmpR family regulator